MEGSTPWAAFAMAGREGSTNWPESEFRLFVNSISYTHPYTSPQHRLEHRYTSSTAYTTTPPPSFVIPYLSVIAAP
jgi:hypothetical protein